MTEAKTVQRAVYGSDGVFYGVGSTPPAEVAAEFGDHIWEAPETAPAGGLLMPMVSAPTERTGHGGVQVAPADPFREPAPEKPAGAAPEATPAAPAAPSGDAPQPPPLSGPGSSVDHWRSYAAAVGVEVPEGAKRAEVVDAVRDAGLPVE